MPLVRFKINDAHVHVGRFPCRCRQGNVRVHYFSPKEVLKVLDSAKINEFVFSSTDAIWDISGEMMHQEAREMVTIAGKRAHPLYWVTGKYLLHDADLNKIPVIYEGLKLHGAETAWLSNPKMLDRIMSIAQERKYMVQIHTSTDDECNCFGYFKWCKRFPLVRFDLAHARPTKELLTILNRCKNVYVDVSFVPTEEALLLARLFPHQIMFGSDIPAPTRYFAKSLTSYLKERICEMEFIGNNLFEINFKRFVGRAKYGLADDKVGR